MPGGGWGVSSPVQADGTTLQLVAGTLSATAALRTQRLTGSVNTSGIGSTSAVNLNGALGTTFAVAGYPLNEAIFPAPGSITKLTLKLNAAQGAVGTTVTVNINNVASAIVLTIVALDPAGATYTWTGSVAVAAGDRVSLDNSGAATLVASSWSLEWVPTA